MTFCTLSSTVIIYLLALLAIAFFTLLERKALGYFHIRKGPNKVGLLGLPQPLADAAKLFLKELVNPLHANFFPFLASPSLALILALILWSLYPHPFTPSYFSFGILLFLCLSSLNVYTTLGAG
jgi:NADH:ubiquinone oxidoreductase subunit H